MKPKKPIIPVLSSDLVWNDVKIKLFGTEIKTDTSIDICDEVNNKVFKVHYETAQKLKQSLEDKIIDKLEEKGYNFETREALLDFASTKCHVIQKGHEKHLFVGNKEICWWDVRTEIGLADGKITVTMNNKP